MTGHRLVPLLGDMWSEIERAMADANRFPHLRPITEELMNDYFSLIDSLMIKAAAAYPDLARGATK